MAIGEARVAVIGAGNLGSALILGAMEAGGMAPARLTAADPREAVLAGLSARGVRTVRCAAEAVAGQELIVLAVKPQVADEVLAEIAGRIEAGQVIVSVMAGVATGRLEGRLGQGVPVVRAMPQMLARLGAGATAICAGAHAGAEHVGLARSFFALVGTTVEVPERLMDAVTGLAGSGPAYAYTIIQALTDAGVAAGLPRDVAQALTAQTLIGAGRMVLEEGQNPAVLRDQVTSPGGTTIAGLFELEAGGLRAACMRAVRAATARARELGAG